MVVREALFTVTVIAGPPPGAVRFVTVNCAVLLVLAGTAGSPLYFAVMLCTPAFSVLMGNTAVAVLSSEAVPSSVVPS